MLVVRSGFIALCCYDPDSSNFMNYHCVIHQQALAWKVMDFSHTITLVIKLINSTRAKVLQRFVDLLTGIKTSVCKKRETQGTVR